MPAAVDSSFEIAFWFLDRAAEGREHLQPQKLHRLLYLAQAYYAVAFDGRKLMPAVFVAEEMGPIEPTIYKAFARGRPDVEVSMALPEQVETFLDSLWRRFGSHTVDRLDRLCRDNTAYESARERGHRAEIPLSDMLEAYARRKKAAEEPAGRPKLMRAHDGRPVAVRSWAATLKPAGREPGR